VNKHDNKYMATRVDLARTTMTEAASSWGELGEVMIKVDNDEGSTSTQVRVRKRGRRYRIDDMGAGVDAPAQPHDWLDTARTIAVELDVNVNRVGVVFVPAVDGADIAGLIVRIADASFQIRAALG
jgi:hypothetical protein